jgi:hypothetical protein
MGQRLDFRRLNADIGGNSRNLRASAPIHRLTSERPANARRNIT